MSVRAVRKTLRRLATGMLDCAQRIYHSLGPAFFGLRTTLLTLLLVALWRILRPEGLKEHSPIELGQALGVDRAPEVKMLPDILRDIRTLLGPRRVTVVFDRGGFSPTIFQGPGRRLRPARLAQRTLGTPPGSVWSEAPSPD